MKRAEATGFTLVEILVVVILLGILAAIVLPQVGNAVNISRESNLRENLAKIRMQIEVYENEHGGLPDGEQFVEQMTKYTDFHGNVSDTPDDEHRFGPYLEQMPANPVTGSREVRVSGDGSEYFPPGDADGGWWYNEVTGRFYADLTDEHVTAEGEPYNRF